MLGVFVRRRVDIEVMNECGSFLFIESVGMYLYQTNLNTKGDELVDEDNSNSDWQFFL